MRAFLFKKFLIVITTTVGYTKKLKRKLKSQQVPFESNINFFKVKYVRIYLNKYYTKIYF